MQKFIYYIFLIPPSTGKQSPVSPNRNVHDMHTHTQERFNRILLHIPIINTCVFIFYFATMKIYLPKGFSKIKHHTDFRS